MYKHRYFYSLNDQIAIQNISICTFNSDLKKCIWADFVRWEKVKHSRPGDKKPYLIYIFNQSVIYFCQNTKQVSHSIVLHQTIMWLSGCHASSEPEWSIFLDFRSISVTGKYVVLQAIPQHADKDKVDSVDWLWEGLCVGIFLSQNIY